MTNVVSILTGHVSPETAYIVNDYPYGFRLRCAIRYWLDVHPTHGVRMISQTSNPNRGHAWNKPKASTYSKFGAAMYLDDKGHVHQSGLTEYTDGAEAANWRATFGHGVPDAARDLMDRWVAAKVAYDGARTKDDPLSKGLVEARRAFLAPITLAIPRDLISEAARRGLSADQFAQIAERVNGDRAAIWTIIQGVG